MGQIHSMLECQVFCNGSKSCFLHCLHYRLPCARESPCSCLVGGPLAQQVQHTVCWVASFTCFDGLHDLVVHTQEGAKVPPPCIQLVVKSFNNVCSQRRERQEGRCCICSKAHCSSITDSPAVSGAGGVGGVRVVASSETGTTEGGVADGMQGRERKHSKTAYFLVT